MPYAHATHAPTDLDLPTHAEWVFVGAREAGSTSVALGAFGRRDEVLKRTSDNKPHKHNDVWWYRTDGYSFGFAPSPDVSQYRADSLYPRDERRLSWHLQGDGGWRAGGVCDLNGETPWRKLFFCGYRARPLYRRRSARSTCTWATPVATSSTTPSSKAEG